VTLAELLAKATDGPWSWMGGYPQRVTNPGAILVAETFNDPDSLAYDAELIALTPDLARLALDMGEALRAIGEEWGWPQEGGSETELHDRIEAARPLLARLDGIANKDKTT